MDDKVKGAAAVVALGAVLAVIATLLPWIKASTGFGSVSRSGLDFADDAKILLVLGILAGLVALGRLTGWEMPSVLRGSVVIAGLIMVADSIYDYTQVKDRVDSAAGQDTVLVTMGTGVYLAIAGSVLVLLGGLALASAAKAARTAEPAEDRSHVSVP